MRSAITVIATTVLLAMSQPSLAGDDVETSGDILRAAIPLTAFAYTFYKDDADGRGDFYRSFAANLIATHALKELIDKDRPDGSDDNAFPSGHTSMAFQGAAFFHQRYGLEKAWPAYLLAAYTGWTRIDADKHDEVDVLAGAAIGILSSVMLVERMPGVAVSVSFDGAGVTFSGRF